MRDFDTAIDLIIRFLNALPRFIREGATPQTLMLAAPLLFYIFKFQAFKRTMGRYFPGLVKGETVNPVYVGNQMEIKHNLSRLLKERGMEWEAYNSPQPISKQARTQHIRNYYSYSHKVIQWGNKLERMKKMKDYLKKLGRTKFQAFLMMTGTNITTLIMVLNGSLDLDADVEKWMPAISLLVQMIATAVYVWVEGSIDKANVDAKQVKNQPNEGESYY